MNCTSVTPRSASTTIDVYHRSGLYAHALPFTRVEGAGIVETVGPGVTRFQRGARVAYAAIAHRDLEARRTCGSLVLTI